MDPDGTASSLGGFALALSGGGVRAMAFHLGVFRFLAEQQVLEKVTHVSTVSGGSLLVGLMLHQTKMRWPGSENFRQSVFEPLAAQMCSRSLMWAALRQLLFPWNWIHFLSRANLVAKALEKWGVKYRLTDLPRVPEWSINGTTAENGRRFRFKRDSLGDYQFGYADGGTFPLSQAMAVSAAFPGGIGPLSIDATSFEWKRRPVWDVNSTAEVTKLPFKRLRLYDGGVYDNLGLEPYFDSGTQTTKVGGLSIYVSDAGAPLTVGRLAGPLSPWRVKRLLDIMSEQSRALRVRSFVQFLKGGAIRGAYLAITMKVPGGDEREGARAISFPTNLSRLKRCQFDVIASHGYSVARATEAQYGYLKNLAVASVAPVVG